MSNLEIMEKAVNFTNESYCKYYSKEVESGKIKSSELESAAVEYSGKILFNVLIKTPGVYKSYTRQGNLRQDIINLSDDSIKTELLKNIVNVATYHRIKDTRAGNRISDVFDNTLTDDEIAVVLLNNLVNHGVERGYEILNNPMILASVCKTFAKFRRPDIKEMLDNISKTDKSAMYVNNEIDIYYARYGERPKGVDISGLDSYGYDVNGGFSGFGRK